MVLPVLLFCLPAFGIQWSQAEEFGPEDTGSISKFLSEAVMEGAVSWLGAGVKELEVLLKGLRALQKDQTQKLPTVLARAP